jgi:hypothetical protein
MGIITPHPQSLSPLRGEGITVERFLPFVNLPNRWQLWVGRQIKNRVKTHPPLTGASARERKRSGALIQIQLMIIHPQNPGSANH